MTDESSEHVQRLIDIEEIKQLKARYFRLINLGDWENWRDLFTDDAEFILPEHGEAHQGRDAFVERVRRSNELAFAPSIHHGHMPEIEIVDVDEARGTWAMFDYLERPWNGIRTVSKGYGYYHEEYRKVNGTWKISRLRLARLRVDRTLSELPD